MKRISVAALSILLILGLCGCNIKSGDYNTVKSAFSSISELKSGKMTVSSSYSRSDVSENSVTDFVFKQNEDGSYCYCQTQYDMDKKAVYCEFSDGKKVSQWLIGNGWSDSTAEVPTKSAPHRYVNLLSTPPDKAALKNLSAKKDADATIYTAEYKADVLNEKLYKDSKIELLSQTDSYTVDKNGRLTSYKSASSIRDHAANMDCDYELCIAVTEQDTVTEVKKPELRDNYTEKK